MNASSNEIHLKPIDVIGMIGGATIAVSLFPQVMKTWKTKSAQDISYTYQGIYICGCTMVNIYALLEGLWPVYAPCLLEESLIISLTIMKFIYDRRKETSTNSNGTSTKKDTDCASLSSSLENLESGTENRNESSVDDFDIDMDGLSVEQKV